MQKNWHQTKENSWAENPKNVFTALEKLKEWEFVFVFQKGRN